MAHVEVALVVEETRQRRWLENQLVKAEHHVLLSCDVDHLQTVHRELQEQPAVWLLLLPASRIERALDYIESVSMAPTLVLDDWPADSEALPRWQGQLLQKLERSLGGDGLARGGISGSAQPAQPEEIWLLGASLGGPESVKEFMTALPAGLPLAFLYVQHIEEAFDQALVTNLNRNSHYRAVMFQREARLNAGEVLIVAPEVKPRFLPFGRVIPASHRWRGQYRPCIDEVAEDLSRLYRERMGLMIFSGTYNDGQAAAHVVQRRGGSVWAQAPASCLCPTMPEAVMSTGLVRVSGTPAQLASMLARRVTREYSDRQRTESY